eukprot:CAMPEP_0196573896 /NCGR_PEP_ID=MMETSP1081-20130531/3713_1 /TAXON_ID=36882 /ORGANISM="Pyramimonas amylifera, Strain CCMP720" /LENGTH=292 /DNA_ID=CAMNT_0041891745 /DNA_START=470 /DNA_END=1347 /DNA_ORIENTATION=-
MTPGGAAVLDFDCVAPSIRRLADSVQRHPSARFQFPAPRCHFTGFDVYEASPKLRNSFTNEVFDLLAVHAAHLEVTGFHSNTFPEKQCTKLVQEPFRPRLPAMWPDEVEFLVKLGINMAPAVYVEYGSGGSTNWYPLLAQRSYSIEHEAQWCGISNKAQVQSCLKENNRLTYLCIDHLGQENVLKQQPKLFEEYIKAIDRIPEDNLDLVLIDGRARIACALYALHRVSYDSIIIVHDFIIRATEQASHIFHMDVILDYYEIVGRSRTIVAFRKKRNLPQGWREAWKSHFGYW